MEIAEFEKNPSIYDNGFCDHVRDENIGLELPLKVRIYSFNGDWYTGVSDSSLNPAEKCICRIPKAWISLNAERNYDRWVGQEVYVIPLMERNTTSQLEDGSIKTVRTFVCSRRRYLEYCGNNNLQKLYTDYFSPGAEKNGCDPGCFSATVTGVIGTASICGVFMEVDGLNINGFLECDNYELVDYRIGDSFEVGILDIHGSGKAYSESPNGNIKETGLEVRLYR